MEAALTVYREPLFILFPIASLLIGAGAFLAFALPLTWLAAANPRRTLAYRLQDGAGANRFFWPSLARLALNLLCVLALSVVLWPLLRLSAVHAGVRPGWFEVAWQLPLFLVADDFCFYFLHRSLHTRWMFKRVHAVHHRVRTPWAIAGGYFHPVEYVLISLVASIGPLLVGAHVVTIWIWAALRQWLAADGHSGFVLPWSPGRLLPGYQGPAFHDWHHRRFVGNYANVFIWFDRWFGTISPGYRDHGRVVPSRGTLTLL
jgi:4-alpha-methyl-delta7-sterol-4alpha-methyl oxidase